MAPSRTRRSVPGKDNVIFVNFGHKDSAALRDDVRASTRRPLTDRSHNPACNMLFDAVAQSSDSGRIQRGRDYAKRNTVAGLTLSEGIVAGYVQGSQPEPFRAELVLHLPPASHTAVVEKYLTQARGAGKTWVELAGDGHVAAMLVAGLSPEETPTADIVPTVLSRCTCPDHARGNVCKHVIAVALCAREILENHPAKLFDLVYVDTGRIDAQVKHEALRQATEEHALSAEEFWAGGELPPIVDLEPRNSLDHGDMRLLRQALKPVTYSRMEEVRIIEELSEIFDDLMNTTSFDDPEHLGAGASSFADASSDVPQGVGWQDYQSFDDISALPRLRERTLTSTESPASTDAGQPTGDSFSSQGSTGHDTAGHGPASESPAGLSLDGEGPGGEGPGGEGPGDVGPDGVSLGGEGRSDAEAKQPTEE